MVVFVIRDVFLYLEEIQKHLKRKKKSCNLLGKAVLQRTIKAFLGTVIARRVGMGGLSEKGVKGREKQKMY